MINFTLLTVIGLILVFLSFLFLLVKLLLLRNKLRESSVFFEVQPPRVTEQSSYMTQQFFTLIHGLAKQKSGLGGLFTKSKRLSFEIVSNKDQGIRYLIRVNCEDAELVRRSLLSYLPGLSIKEIEDYIPDELDKRNIKIVAFRLSNHFAFPLRKQSLLEEYDPIAYITGNMTKLMEDELISFQMIVSPIDKNSLKDVGKISDLIYTNKDLVTNLKHLNEGNLLLRFIKLDFFILLHVLLFPVGLLVFLTSEGKEGPFLNLALNNVVKKTNNVYEEELERLVKGKLDQYLFTTSLRLLIISKNQAEIQRRKRGFASSLALFGNSGFQSLVQVFEGKFDIFRTLEIFTFKHRLLGFLGNSILSASEVSDIYHFPYTTTTKTENINKVLSRELPAPVSLKAAKNQDVVFAKNTYGGVTTMIGLSEEERRRHVYILGGTGRGKSTLLLSMIDEDLKRGKGICVIDPHGDLIEKVLPLISKERIKDVVYFNPDDISYPIGLNLLELSEGLDEEESLREKEFIAESVISLFHKIYDDRYSGPRMEYILRNTIHTAFNIAHPTLFTIYKLLVNTNYRNSVVKTLEDENLRDFWKYEFAKAGDYQKVKMISPITNKIGRFLFSPIGKRILEQEKSTINFDEILNDGKILLCNLSKGKIGEENSEIFGTLILARIQLAAMKRARVEAEKRKDFYLYVDEFQNFATPSFAQILSEARKYKLNAILAHQTTSQIKDKTLVDITLANTGTIICFRTANPEDEKLILPQFLSYVETGEISNLPTHHFYVKINALDPQEPFSGETIQVEVKTNKEKVNEIIKTSRRKYTKRYLSTVKVKKVITKKEISTQKGKSGYN